MEVIFHIGMPRTATTFLQQDIFPKIDVNFVNFNKYTRSRRFNVRVDKKINRMLLYMEK